MKCFVPSCKNDFHITSPLYSAHRFPKDEAQRSAWIQAIGTAHRRVLTEEINFNIVRICSDHFAADCFYFSQEGKSGNRKRVLSGVIPTLYGAAAVENGKQNAFCKVKRASKRRDSSHRIRQEPIRIKKCTETAQKESKELINNALHCTGNLNDSSWSTAKNVFRLEKFPHVCRLCLKPPKSETEVMISLDAPDHVLDGTSIGKFIAEITPRTEALVRNKQHLLPNVVCLPCLELLRFFAKYLSKINFVHQLMNALVELKQLNSSPIVDLFNNESEALRSVIKDLGLNRKNKFTVEDLLNEFPQYELASFEGFVVKEEPKEELEVSEQMKCEVLVQELSNFPTESDVIYAEECTAEELSELTKDNPELLVTDSSDDYPIFKKPKPPIKSKYGGRKLDKPLSCTKCSFSTYFKRNFMTHQEKHAKREARVYACKHPGCSKVFKTRLEYKRHGPTAHKSFICDTCGLPCSTKTALKNHMARHMKQYEHVCSYCQRGHNTKGDLRIHITKMHLRTATFPCETCGLVFHRKFILQEHQRRHNETYGFPCHMCDKKFKVAHSLRNHIRIVHEKFRHECSYCDAGFFTTYNLNNHIESVHGIQTRFVCDVCVQTFNSREKLDSHRPRHDNPKELECGLCLSAFKSEDLLSEHLCITYRSDYVCCGRDMRYHYMYNKHMMLKHGVTINARVKPVPGQLMGQMRALRKRVESCLKCEEIFPSRTLKKQHMAICTFGEDKNNGHGEDHSTAEDVLITIASNADVLQHEVIVDHNSEALREKIIINFGTFLVTKQDHGANVDVRILCNPH